MNGSNIFPFAVNVHNANSAATTNSTSVKAVSAGLYSLIVSNNGAGAAYLKFYDTVAAPNVGVDRPFIIVAIPAAGTVQMTFGDYGMLFVNGLGYGITGAMADADTTAVAASQVKLVLNYQ